eukprot:ANDGO_00551.mRNA.1 Putative tRNA 2'-phosphotransferase
MHLAKAVLKQMASGSRRRPVDDLTRISKTMSYLLRHGATKEGLAIADDGFMHVDDLLSHRNLKSLQVTRVILEHVVASDSKGRYEFDASRDRIRATQGHSIQLDGIEKDYVLLTQETIPAIVVHGTYSHLLPAISQEGLKRFSRMFIHFATGIHGDVSVKSGMRNNVDVYIYVDTHGAMRDGIQFFLSSNGVVLSSGVNGVLDPKYFARIETRTAGR